MYDVCHVHVSSQIRTCTPHDAVVNTTQVVIFDDLGNSLRVEYGRSLVKKQKKIYKKQKNSHDVLNFFHA